MIQRHIHPLFQPYGPNKIPAKWECVGHVQKRVGGRLRRLKKNFGSEVLSDGKKLSGIGRLTDKWMNKLQNWPSGKTLIV